MKFNKDRAFCVAMVLHCYDPIKIKICEVERYQEIERADLPLIFRSVVPFCKRKCDS